MLEPRKLLPILKRRLLKRLESLNKYIIGGKSNMKTKDLIAEVISLPVEQRVLITDSLLKSLNPPKPARHQ
jgi:hypothetical protein